jgi:hypothetical protein
MECGLRFCVGICSDEECKFCFGWWPWIPAPGIHKAGRRKFSNLECKETTLGPVRGCFDRP